ncbi:MAG TPA: DUF4856 domain-containing protein [Deltaproteobacteria bacterium]|nr:DUF4856 domain-containing protein [Deltaproteobacteria bacterium]
MRTCVFAFAFAFAFACSGDGGQTSETAGGGIDLEGYAFASRFDGADSVSYSGQVFRQLLIEDMKAHIGGLTERIDSGFSPEPGEVAAELDFYVSFDSASSGGVPVAFSSTPAPLQAIYDDVSTGKDLVGKIAGNDAIGQHRDWSVGFAGWDEAGVTTPESLVRLWMSQLDAAAVERSLGNIPVDPSGVPVSAVYLTADGRDLQQLLEELLRVAVAFSQGADDYLDDDEPGKGLLSDHTAADGDGNYTVLEHAWDEGFGYFGAARTYGGWDDAAIADPGYADVDGDGAVDLLTEVSWGHSGTAAKRDAAAVVATDFTAEAWGGLYEGRALLASTEGALTPEQLVELQGHRDRALSAWEAAIAATVVHYINAVLQDMAAIGTDEYSFLDHAGHWSEMKGSALAFQFNRRSPILADFEQLHRLLRQAPALGPGDELEQYASDLRVARALIGDAFGFDAANLGDDDGLGGW